MILHDYPRQNCRNSLKTRAACDMYVLVMLLVVAFSGGGAEGGYDGLYATKMRKYLE